jgi:HAD superfamily hydrolase (TIGR01509 family)
MKAPSKSLASYMARLLVIFDLDGTLVDSEALCNQAFLDLLPSLKETVESLVHRYRGKKLSEIFCDIENKIGHALPEDFELNYRQHVTDLFASELKPIKNVPEMLRLLRRPFCIASSGPPEKIKHALAVTKLAPHFGERLFSSYVVKSWKPDPGLFLHAAAVMGFAPAQCVVIEDSPVGLEAAAAAGMHALHYAPESVVEGNVFSDMLALPSILERISIPTASI